jgi:hypothetical protein
MLASSMGDPRLSVAPVSVADVAVASAAAAPSPLAEVVLSSPLPAAEADALMTMAAGLKRQILEWRALAPLLQRHGADLQVLPSEDDSLHVRFKLRTKLDAPDSHSFFLMQLDAELPLLQLTPHFHLVKLAIPCVCPAYLTDAQLDIFRGNLKYFVDKALAENRTPLASALNDLSQLIVQNDAKRVPNGVVQPVVAPAQSSSPVKSPHNQILSPVDVELTDLRLKAPVGMYGER